MDVIWLAYQVGLWLSRKRQISKRIPSFGIRKIFLNRIQKVLIIKGKISKLLYTKIKNFSLKKDKPTLHRKKRENQDTEWEELSLVQKTDKKLNPEYTNINRKKIRTFLVAQCLRILLPLQGTRVWSLVKEDHTCLEQLSPWVTTTEPTLPRALLCNKRSHNNAKLVHCNLPQLEKAHTQQQRSSADKNKLI